MDVNDQIKTDGNIAVELKQFYGSSQTYLKRLERHDEETFAPYIELCKAKIPAGASILDCGCGIGTSSYLLAKEGFKVTATDISPLFISEAKKKYGEQPNLKFSIEDASKMSFSNNSLDAVCCFDMLEHVTDVNSVLREMSRVVKAKGLLIIFMPNHLDPIQHLITCIRWRRKDKYKPWEANNQIMAFGQFIRSTYLSITKAIGINRKIYYLQPVLSDDENSCGEDYDATWLTNCFDIENALKGLGFLIKSASSLQSNKSRIVHIMKKYRFPKAVQSLYLKMRAPCIILGVKE